MSRSTSSRKIVKDVHALEQLTFNYEVTNMAVKKAVKGKGKAVAVAVPAKAKGKTPTVVFLPGKLRARVRLGAIALNTTTSDIIRECLEEWTKKNAKKIASVVADMDDSTEDEDVEETEDVEEADADEDADDEEDADDDEDEE